MDAFTYFLLWVLKDISNFKSFAKKLPMLLAGPVVTGGSFLSPDPPKLHVHSGMTGEHPKLGR